MLYQENMLCKHFKGSNLKEKNIYRIIKLNVKGTDVDTSKFVYTGDGIIENATDLVLYQNVFQNNKYFVREYKDISSVLSSEKQEQFKQTYKVQPLNQEEIKEVSSSFFIKNKYNIENEKQKILKNTK